jgi:hypothetical protein
LVKVIDNSTISATTAGGQAPEPGTRSDPHLPPDITIISGSGGILLANNSTVTTSANMSTGGNIEIDPNGGPLTLKNNSVIQATAGGSGNGGNIAIGCKTATGACTGPAGDTILQASAILATTNRGTGGQIDIYVDPKKAYIQDAQSLVSADSAAGNNGSVIINAPNTNNLNSGLRVPAVEVQKAAVLSPNACRRDAHRSTFVSEGRGGVVPGPEGYLTAVAPPASPSPSGASKTTDNSEVNDAAAFQFAWVAIPNLDCR